MKLYRFAPALAGVLALSACEKGPAGDDGPAGPAGPIGGVYAAPIIEDVFLPFVTERSEILVFGQNFHASLNSNHVFFGNREAQIVDGDATTLVVTAGVEDTDLGSDFLRAINVTVVANNLASNPFEVLQVQPGVALGLASPRITNPSGLTITATNDVIMGDSNGQINQMTSLGLLTRRLSTNGGGTTVKAFDRPDGLWILTSAGDLRRLDAQGNLAQVASLGATIADGVFDANGNFFALRATTGIIRRWDATTHAITTFDTANGVTASGVSGMTRIGADLYVGVVGAGTPAASTITRIPIADPATEVVFAIGFSLIANVDPGTDGTNLYVWGDVTATAGTLNQVIKIDNAGVVTAFSAQLFGATPTSLAADSTGRVYASRSARMVRYAADGLTVETWASAVGQNGFAVLGDRIFFGSTSTSPCTLGNLNGDVLWEPITGGWRRASGNLCSRTQLAISGGQILQANRETGNLERINPDTGAITTIFDNDANDDLIFDVLDPFSFLFGAVAVDANGNIYVFTEDPNNGGVPTIAKFTSAGALVDIAFVDDSHPTQPLDTVTALAVQGNRLVIATFDSFNFTSSVLFEAPLATGGTPEVINGGVLLSLNDMSLTPDGALLLADADSGSLVFLDAANNFEHRYADAVSGSHWIEDPSGYLFGLTAGNTYALVLP